VRGGEGRVKAGCALAQDNDALLKGQCLEKLSNPVLPIDVTAPRCLVALRPL
jgi:hypothetical protein